MNLEIKKLDFSYSGERILKNITLDVEGNQCVAILGPNGAGKSTLIQCINRLLKPEQGTICINGININMFSRKNLARQLSYIPQTTMPMFSLQVFDMLLMGRRQHISWRNSSEDKNKVIEVMKRLNIEHLAVRPFNELSGGMQQKVIIARAIVQETAIILLDEPISNLDIRHQFEVMNIVRGLIHTRKILALMVVHDLNIAAGYADKIIIMNKGQIIFYGPPGEVLSKDNISSVYGVEAHVGRIEDKLSVVPIKIANRR
jgi:iron complex transport system ATP-binding protein